MNQIWIISVFALAFVQLVSSHTDACLDAQSAYLNDTTCANTTDIANICNGTCRAMIDNIISICDNVVS